MERNVLIVLCGISGSGKSTFAELLESGNFYRVCPDLIRKEKFGDESIQKDGDKIFRYAYNQMIDYGHDNLNVVFDATNVTKKARQKIIDNAKGFFDFIICYYINTPLEIALDRNARRNRKVPEDVVKSQYDRFEMPTIKEGFDYVSIIDYNLN